MWSSARSNPGILWLDLAMEGAFALWSLQPLLYRQKVYLSALAQLGQGLTQCSIIRLVVEGAQVLWSLLLLL